LKLPQARKLCRAGVIAVFREFCRAILESIEGAAVESGATEKTIDERLSAAELDDDIIVNTGDASLR
jgi:hypothetical protein